MRPPRNLDINKAMTLVGINPYKLEKLLMETPAHERTEAYKKAIKDARKARLRQCHPDLFQEEGTREKALQTTKEVNEAADALLLLRPQERQRRRHTVVQMHVHPSAGFGGTTSAATNDYHGFGGTVRVYWRR